MTDVDERIGNFVRLKSLSGWKSRWERSTSLLEKCAGRRRADYPARSAFYRLPSRYPPRDGQDGPSSSCLVRSSIAMSMTRRRSLSK